MVEIISEALWRGHALKLFVRGSCSEALWVRSCSEAPWVMSLTTVDWTDDDVWNQDELAGRASR
jgi:hypothetical protein